jgi:3D (Asp-Asp-Asp) domain-containing protein
MLPKEEAKTNGLQTFEITAYTNSPEDTGKSRGDADYGITATGKRATAGRTVAADWNVLPPGTVVEIEGIGRRIVEDKGGAIKGNRLDLFLPSRSAVDKFGRRKLKVEIISK